MNSKVIYTTLVGNYDTLQDPKLVVDGWDYICFSNNLTDDQFRVWKIRKIPFPNENKTVLSRYPKLNPHLVLSDYKHSVYLDSNIQITGNYIYRRAEELIKQKSQISIVKHPLRDCIYDEAEICVKDGRESKKNIRLLTDFLKTEGFPKHMGLFENNLIFRDHLNKEIINLSEAWWRMFMSFAKRDQLSLCYLLWMQRITCEALMPTGESTRNHKDFAYQSHQRNILRSIKLRFKILMNKI